ncbi:MAG: type II toxin-antitoxin system RelE/ParE family toxin [Lutibacter sp.]|nr:type II toxin-antitoxin system RelE/ParE family toxin [Lutibacter sp.]
MGLKIYWTEFSEKELQHIFEYYKEKASSRIAKRLVDGIYNETFKLEKQPEIGQIEELIKEREQGHRYLVFKNYKIIYWLNKTSITNFDTKRNN